MKVTSAIKKATLATKCEPVVKGQFYYFTFGNEILSFAVNGRMSETAEITCINTRRKGDENDSMIDYFAGTYHDNLTRALKFIGAC